MMPEQIVQTFNNCYIEIEKIAQSPDWLHLIKEGKVDPEASTHLGDVLHYLLEAMGCVEEIVEKE